MTSKQSPFQPPSLALWADEVRRASEPAYIIRPFLPADNLILVSGHPKDGKKTWLAMLSALVAASGISVGPMQLEAAVPVLYIYREGARKPTLNRFDALAAGHGLPPVSTYANFYLHHRGAWWLDEGDWVRNTCRFVSDQGIKLVYIDTFAKSMQGEENSARDIGRAVQTAERLRDSGATVILVHHLRKANLALSAGDSGYPEPDKDLRGSSALAGAYETHWAVRAYQGMDPLLLIGGKESEWMAYNYKWDFVVHDEQLVSVRVDLGVAQEVPYITPPNEWE